MIRSVLVYFKMSLKCIWEQTQDEFNATNAYNLYYDLISSDLAHQEHPISLQRLNTEI